MITAFITASITACEITTSDDTDDDDGVSCQTLTKECFDWDSYWENSYDYSFCSNEADIAYYDYEGTTFTCLDTICTDVLDDIEDDCFYYNQ